MKNTNRHFFKIFIYCSAVSLLLNNAVLAGGQINSADDVKTINLEIEKNIKFGGQDGQKLLDLYRSLFLAQKNAGLYRDAIKTALKAESLNEKLYGKNSENLFYAKMETLDLYVITKNEALRKQKLKEIEKIIADIPDNLKYVYYNSLYEFYRNSEDFYTGNEILLKMYNIPNLTKDDKYNVVSRLSANYSYLRDIKNTNKFLNEYYRLANLYDPKDPSRLLCFYERKVYLNNDVENLYKDFMPLYEKAKKNIEKLPKADGKVFLNDLNLYLANYYFEMGEFDKAKEVIDNLLTDTDYQIYMKKTLLITYYDKIKDRKSQKSAINDLKNAYKEFNNYGFDSKIIVKELAADLYKSMGENAKAKKTYYDILDLIDKYYNGSIDMKGKYYTHLADVYIGTGDKEKAVEYLNLALSTCKDIKNSYRCADVLRLKSKLAIQNGNEDDAIKYLSEAEKIYSSVPTGINLADICEQLFYLYENKGDSINAGKYLDKVINIRKKEYGENNVVYYAYLKSKAYFLSSDEDNSKSEALINKVYSDYKNGKIQGEDYEFGYMTNVEIAQKYIEAEDYGNALKYAGNAVKYAYSRQMKKDLYNLTADIYGRQGQTSIEHTFRTLAKRA